jgi:3-deoxy-manno-octulosonate cytidylyltransferase (CMP-KDO synthetase)
MIQRVYEQASRAIEEVWVATDDPRIFDAVKAFNGNVVMTSEDHRSGTDRCSEAVIKISEITGKDYDVVINVQGDEPFIQPQHIPSIIESFTGSPDTEIATLIQPILGSEDIFRTDMVKVVLDNEHNAIYFSRSPIPHIARVDPSQWLEHATFYGHIGLYAYRKSTLHQLSKLTAGTLEKVESLEQLRWLENGFKIKTCLTDSDNFGIDTPEDLEKVIASGIDKYYL